MATIKDVAEDAGVSIATVSCCLSGSKKVRSETKARVMESIDKLKYIPNSSARNLKVTDSKRVGVVLTDIDNYYHSEILKGISSYFQDLGYNLGIAFSNNSPDIERQQIDDFISSNISGLIIITSQPQNYDFFMSRIKNYNIPTVFIERRPDHLDTNFVGFDNYRTTYYLTEKLLQNGYRNIAVMTGYENFSSEADAVRGYKTALQSYNLPVNEALIQDTNMTKEDAFKAILTNKYLDKIDSLITTSENISMGILEAFRVLGIRVPGDVQVIAFGEESWNQAVNMCGVLHTSRTAFSLGKAAAELLLKNIKSPVLFEEKTIIYKDDIINTDLTLSPCRKRKKRTQLCTGSPLRVLMVDLSTSHSIKLLSENFSRQTDIPIEIDFVPQNKLLQNIIHDVESQKNIYDIYMYDIPWLPYMVQNGLISDITEFIEGNKFDKERFFDENLDNCRCEDSYYGVPIIGGSQIMFYRRDLFEDASIRKDFKNKYNIELNPPKTWTEFNGIASFFTRQYNPHSPTEFGTSMAGIFDEEFAPEILIRLWANGGSLWDKYNRVCMNTPENIKAIYNILETFQYVATNPLQTSIEDTVKDFCSGKTAMLVTYTEYAHTISSCIQNNTIGRVGYESIPGQTPASVGWNLGLNPYTNKAKEAFWYFQWLSNKDTNIYLTILDGQSPVKTPYESHELLKLYPWLKLTEKSFAHSHKRNGPYNSKSLVIPQGKIEAILCNVIKNIVNNGYSIDKALDIGQKKLTDLFKSYGYPKPLHFLPDA